MPLYEYVCPQCGKFEELRAIDRRDDKARCPKCSKGAKRVWSVPSDYPCFPHWSQKDGEGFTSKNMRREEVAELDQECRER